MPVIQASLLPLGGCPEITNLSNMIILDKLALAAGSGVIAGGSVHGLESFPYLEAPFEFWATGHCFRGQIQRSFFTGRTRGLFQ